MSARLGLGAFAAVVAFLSMFPAAMPAGYEHLVPGPDAMSGFFLVAHHVGNLFLAICAVWLMSGRCTRGGSLLSIALLSFYVYLVRVSFDPPLGVLVAFSALVLVILAYIAWRMTSAASIMVCRHRGRSASTGEVDDRA
ncbi:hypothetical protein [Sinisalibacter lacisalsi]|uniref:Uncharacterized protein n=1 Tax=Sinisalibacter lacisalsi TaxID=1526570 RepID=A0ABQ1QT90_9RHOB|nr:hypothetical protein [Sinisalibacter lacisalsi]GGD41059.1 hypothetical protein GCM10011358_26130 [Sinisalibacter lacisalsi]